MLNKELLSKFEGSMSNNILLSNYSWFNLGGPAEYLFKPKDKNQLIEFLEFNKKFRYNLTIIGAGSNTLIRDKGIKGVVIKLGSSFSNVDLIDNRTIEAGAGTLDRKISNFAREWLLWL
jgi:UDP-N-acetylmuramate dehydrogenase